MELSNFSFFSIPGRGIDLDYSDIEWFALEMNRAKANRVLPREQHTGHSKHPLPNTRDYSTHGYHQMANTKIILIIFFAAEDTEALYS